MGDRRRSLPSLRPWCQEQAEIKGFFAQRSNGDSQTAEYDPDGGSDNEDEDDGDDDEGSDTSTRDYGVTVRSWFVGVAFGRFDLRLATGERGIPSEPEPFDPLPSVSPGMWPRWGSAREPARTILVDDAGHARRPHTTGVIRRRAVACTDRRAGEPPRAGSRREFFPLHIKMYSKSRRKAPIYWQLATPSASYSVWLYIHAFSKDTFFRVQNDYRRAEARARGAAPRVAYQRAARRGDRRPAQGARRAGERSSTSCARSSTR